MHHFKQNTYGMGTFSCAGKAALRSTQIAQMKLSSMRPFPSNSNKHQIIVFCPSWKKIKEIQHYHTQVRRWESLWTPEWEMKCTGNARPYSGTGKKSCDLSCCGIEPNEQVTANQLGVAEGQKQRERMCKPYLHPLRPATSLGKGFIVFWCLVILQHFMVSPPWGSTYTALEDLENLK